MAVTGRLADVHPAEDAHAIAVEHRTPPGWLLLPASAMAPCSRIHVMQTCRPRTARHHAGPDGGRSGPGWPGADRECLRMAPLFRTTVRGGVREQQQQVGVRAAFTSSRTPAGIVRYVRGGAGRPAHRPGAATPLWFAADRPGRAGRTACVRCAGLASKRDIRHHSGLGRLSCPEFRRVR